MGLAYNPPPQPGVHSRSRVLWKDELNMKTKIVAMLALAAAASMLFTACNPECVDKFDCAPKGGSTASCVANKCTYAAGPVDAGN